MPELLHRRAPLTNRQTVTLAPVTPEQTRQAAWGPTGS